MRCLFAVSSWFVQRASSISVTSSTNTTQCCTVRSWYMRKRIDHWCSVVPEKSQPLGPPFSGKLGKPRFPMERWAHGLGFFCPHWTPMMDSIYLTHAILPRLSRESFIHWLYWNSRTLSSSDVIVTFKWRHHVKLHLSVFRNFWKLIFK